MGPIVSCGGRCHRFTQLIERNGLSCRQASGVAGRTPANYARHSAATPESPIHHILVAPLMGANASTMRFARPLVKGMGVEAGASGKGVANAHDS